MRDDPESTPDQAINEQALAAIIGGRHGDPFAVLGPHPDADGRTRIRAWLPGARAAEVLTGTNPPLAMARIDDQGLFTLRLPPGIDSAGYRLRVQWGDDAVLIDDPYRFGPTIEPTDIWLHAEGRHERPYGFLGAHPCTLGGTPGVRFALWAPNATRVSVVGDFNAWNDTRHPMRRRPEAGVWEIFIPAACAGDRYKFSLLGPQGEALPWHADPYARQAEFRPATASVVSALPLQDPQGRAARSAARTASRAAVASHREAPISIYEVHPGSWRRVPGQGNRFLSWDELIDELIPYVADMGFTHIELLPVAEHPFDGSWGYQPTALYAPTARLGEPAGLQRFVDACHDAGIGVVLDWVPGHFPADAHALARFDGTPLYEHADPREGWHPDWQTMIYNFGRHEVRCFLAGNARYWVEEFGIDGLRVDAVASMLYRDYSREQGQWVPNRDGGRENYEAISLMQEVNASLGRTDPAVVTIAEESTAWPGVTQATSAGGLGFHYKWNMGWMNDTLRFIARDPAHRRYHLDELSFGLVYAFSENFVLPISHDEVVHGKGSLLGKMPGDDWQRFANLRAYLGFMFGHPGKKLLFMGSEFAQVREWNHDVSLDWHLLAEGAHAGVQHAVRDLNRLLRTSPALHERDCEPDGFEWIIADDRENTVLAFARHARARATSMLVVCNFTPIVRHGYRVGVPHAGRWQERFNSDAAHYGGSGVGNFGSVASDAVPMHGHAQSLSLTLPPLSTLILGAPE
ncbi:MAG: 1,4-alpha-glucan branching protein GlgB [Burkholderiaceae bacterium]